MRYCLHCHHITTGDPLFCNFCGYSYDVKLCPARHINPRAAEACSECGARDFSTPAPKPPFWLVPLLWTVKLIPGLLLSLLSLLFLNGLVQSIGTSSGLQTKYVLIGLVLALLWWIYVQLPPSIKRLFHVLGPRSGSKPKKPPRS